MTFLLTDNVAVRHVANVRAAVEALTKIAKFIEFSTVGAILETLGLTGIKLPDGIAADTPAVCLYQASQRLTLADSPMFDETRTAALVTRDGALYSVRAHLKDDTVGLDASMIYPPNDQDLLHIFGTWDTGPQTARRILQSIGQLRNKAEAPHVAALAQIKTAFRDVQTPA